MSESERLESLFLWLACELARARGSRVVNDEDYAVVYELSLRLIPADRRAVMEALAERGEMTTEEVLQQTAADAETLEDLEALEIVERRGGRWRLTDEVRTWWEESKPCTGRRMKAH